MGESIAEGGIEENAEEKISNRNLKNGII